MSDDDGMTFDLDTKDGDFVAKRRLAIESGKNARKAASSKGHSESESESEEETTPQKKDKKEKKEKGPKIKQDEGIPLLIRSIIVIIKHNYSPS